MMSASPFLALSDSLQFYILAFCDADSLFQCSHVKRSWFIYLEGEEPWRTLSYHNMCRALFSLYKVTRVQRRSSVSSPTRGDGQGGHALPTATVVFDPFADPSYDFSGTYEAQQRQQEEEEKRLARQRTGTYYLEEISNQDPQNHNIFQYINASSPFYIDPASEGRSLPYPSLRCPIPPRTRFASTENDFSWDTINRKDGGCGGAREFYMRFLRYVKFDLLYSNGAKGSGFQPLEEEEAEEDDGEGVRSSCYYCKAFRRGQRRRPFGGWISYDNQLIISENTFSVYSQLSSVGGESSGSRWGTNKWHTLLLSKVPIRNERTQSYYKKGAGGRRMLRPEEERYLHEADHEGEGLFLSQRRIPFHFRCELLPPVEEEEEDGEVNASARQTPKGSIVIGFVEWSQSSQYEVRKNEQLNQKYAASPEVEVDDEVEAWFAANVEAALEEDGFLTSDLHNDPNGKSKKNSPAGGGSGGVFVGDLADSFGYSSDGLLYSNGMGCYQFGPSLKHHDIVSLVFCLEEDYVEIGVNGNRVGTMGTDIFSDGLTYIPAVSVKGAGVTLLPFSLSE